MLLPHEAIHTSTSVVLACVARFTLNSASFIYV
jgi:hypothetical protein